MITQITLPGKCIWPECPSLFFAEKYNVGLVIISGKGDFCFFDADFAQAKFFNKIVEVLGQVSGYFETFQNIYERKAILKFFKNLEDHREELRTLM